MIETTNKFTRDPEDELEAMVSRDREQKIADLEQGVWNVFGFDMSYTASGIKAIHELYLMHGHSEESSATLTLALILANKFQKDREDKK